MEVGEEEEEEEAEVPWMDMGVNVEGVVGLCLSYDLFFWMAVCWTLLEM